MLFVPKKIRLHARRNLGIGNKVITPINKDFFIELGETINQSQIEREILIKIKILYQNTCLQNIMVLLSSHDGYRHIAF